MGDAQGLGQLLGQLQGGDDRQRVLAAAQLGQFVGQRDAGEVVDDRIGKAVIGDVEIADDSNGRILELRDRLHAATETRGQILVLVGCRA